MSEFYTNCVVAGDEILYRGIKDGEPVKKRVRYKPTLFIPGKKESEYKTINGMDVSPMQFDSISDAKEFISSYKDVEGFEVFGNTNYHYAYIADVSPETIDVDLSAIRISTVDIEVNCEDGLPSIEDCNGEITAITVRHGDSYHVYGKEFDYQTDRVDLTYHSCSGEKELLNSFLDDWEDYAPDVVSGWNVTFFDIPYLKGRIEKVLKLKNAKRLSPFKKLSQRQVFFMGQQQTVWTMVGVSVLDYLELYRKFAPKKRESYSLNHISHVELNEKKLSYAEYKDLDELCEKDYQKFIDYNVKDVDLVCQLEEKMGFIEQVIYTAYDAKVNYNDVFAQVRMWDTIIFNYFRRQKIVLPQKKDHEKSASYEGAYVKDPIVGLHKWVVSLDLNALYPSLIAQFNISPETIVPQEYKEITVDELLEHKYDLSELSDNNLSMAANGHHFDTSEEGFLPKILMRMYEDRKWAKREQLKAEQELELIEEEMKIRGIGNV